MADPVALRRKAEQLESESKKGGFLKMFSNKQDTILDAIDLFVQAANAYKLQNNMMEAGMVFEKVARLQEEQNDADDAANTRVDAFKAYRMVNPEKAAACITKSIDRYCMRGNFRRAAGYQEQLGGLYEETDDVGKAREAFEKAAGWYENDGAQALANKLWLKVADLAALQDDFLAAVSRYEKVAAASIDNNLMKYSVKDYFLRAGICHLAMGDLVAIQRALAKYAEMDPSFVSQREYMLLKDLFQALSDQDADTFSDSLYQYDQISKLDRWKTTMLVKAKAHIAPIPSGGGPGGGGAAAANPDDEFA